MSTTRRRTRNAVGRTSNELELEKTASCSDTDGGDEGFDDQMPTQQVTKGHSKGEAKLKKVFKRLFFGTLLLLSLCMIIAMGHVATLALVSATSLSQRRVY